MKRIAVKVMGNAAEPRDTTIYPGTSARDILRELNLEGYLLCLPNSERYFATEENVYKNVVDGDKLFAMSSAEVGGI